MSQEIVERLFFAAQQYHEMFLSGRGGDRWSDDGKYQSSAVDVRSHEMLFEIVVPRFEREIREFVRNERFGPSAAPVILLLGWATEYEEVAAVLRTASVGSQYHQMHAAALHALLPLMTVTTFPKVISIRDLVRVVKDEQEDIGCVYRSLRLLRHMPLSLGQFQELANAKTVFQRLVSTSMHIGVTDLAEQVIRRLAAGYVS